MRPPDIHNEAERLAALERYDVVDSLPEPAYDDLLRIAAAICNAPLGAVTLIDGDRQWFKSTLALDGAAVSRDIAFCAHAIATPDAVFEVPDASVDPRFSRNPFVLGAPNLRFYAGAPLVTPEGHAIGALCVMDTVPRELDDWQRQALQSLSRQVCALLELRRSNVVLRGHLAEREWYEAELNRRETELRAENVALSALSQCDALTGLGNRRAFSRHLAEHVAGAHPFVLAVIDIDHFKAINDTYGHAAGDHVIAEIAARLREIDGGRGFLARYGGEEFGWLFGDASLETALQLAENARAGINAFVFDRPVSISVGVAQRRVGDDEASLWQRADQALYAAKRGGRNRVEVARDDESAEPPLLDSVA